MLMCGRFTNLYTWEEIYAYYNLIGETPANWRPSHNVCPTDPVGMIALAGGRRTFERLRWGLIPYWWSKPLKELRLATFNARAETVETKPFFREASSAGAASSRCRDITNGSTGMVRRSRRSPGTSRRRMARS